MNYIFLVNFTHFAGDGKSRPTAKGRYKYSNMKKKTKTTEHTTTLRYVPRVETFNPSERWLVPFSAFQTFSESFFGGFVAKGPAPSWWPRGFSGGLVGNIGEKGEDLVPELFVLHARTCHPARLFQSCLWGRRWPAWGHVAPRTAPQGSRRQQPRF